MKRQYVYLSLSSLLTGQLSVRADAQSRLETGVPWHSQRPTTAEAAAFDYPCCKDNFALEFRLKYRRSSSAQDAADESYTCIYPHCIYLLTAQDDSSDEKVV